MRRSRRFARGRRRRLNEISAVYRNRETLLSKGEAAFFGPLTHAVAGRFLIMCKVRLADIITCSHSAWRRGMGSAISQKHLDFVLCDLRSTRFVLAIELDDHSHDRPDRRRRDAFVDQVMAGAGVRLIRFQARAQYCVPTLTKVIEHELSTGLFSPPVMSNLGFECHERPRLRTDPAGRV